MIQTQKEIEVPNLVDCSDEVFEQWIDSARYGMTLSVHNLLATTYNHLSDVRSDLVKSAKEHQESGDTSSDEYNKILYTTQQTFAMMQRVENRVFRCKKRLEVIRNTPANKGT